MMELTKQFGWGEGGGKEEASALRLNQQRRGSLQLPLPFLNGTRLAKEELANFYSDFTFIEKPVLLWVYDYSATAPNESRDLTKKQKKPPKRLEAHPKPAVDDLQASTCCKSSPRSSSLAYLIERGSDLGLRTHSGHFVPVIRTAKSRCSRPRAGKETAF